MIAPTEIEPLLFKLGITDVSLETVLVKMTRHESFNRKRFGFSVATLWSDASSIVKACVSEFSNG